MGDQVQAVFQRAFRSGLAQAYNLSPQSEIIKNPELFYSTFRTYVAIWNPNIPLDAVSGFPAVNNVVWDFPLMVEPWRNLTQICITSPFDSFGRAISCLSMPYVSLGLADASSSDRNLAAKYGVYKDVPKTVSNVTLSLESYLFNSFRVEPDCSIYNLTRNDTKQSTLDLQGVAKCIGHFCENASDQYMISADIIGIGIWTAYLIQVGICFVAPILAVLFRQLIKRRVPFSRPISRPHGSEGVKQKSSGDRLENFQAAFTTSLVDFQKAQCYYMMAIQIASVTTLYRTQTDSTVAQWQATSTVVRVVATLGMLAPTIILLCLWISEQRSWYILFLAVVTSALSLFVFFEPNVTHIPDRLFMDPGNLDSQYTNTYPFSLCSVKLDGNGPTWHGLSTTWAIYLCFLILAFITVDHIFNLGPLRSEDQSHTLPKRNFQQHLKRSVAYLCSRKKSVLTNASRRKACNIAKLIILTGVMITFFYILGQVISSLQSYYTAMMVSQDWTFGQIVSVAIWIPIVVDWAHLSFGGMESGSQYRIPHPFQVTQVVASKSGPVTTSSSDGTISENENGTELEGQEVAIQSRRRTATTIF